jgi:putative copper export protein
MDAQFWINVIVRWIHVTSVVVGVGAIVFVRFVLLPASGEDAGGLAARMLPGFRRVVHITLGLLLLTGIYNLVLIIPRADALGELKSRYHMVLGIKILLALALMGIASAALARSRAGSASFGSPRSLLLAVLLAGIILFLSALLRRTWDLAPRLPTPVGVVPAAPSETGSAP